MNATATKSWLWPDRTIGKAESRVLREQHNALVSENAELVAAANKLRAAVDTLAGEISGRSAADWGVVNDALVESGRAILKAEGGHRD